MTTATARPTAEHRRWRNAVFAIFALSGMGLASFAARVPSARDDLHIDAGAVGLLIVCISIGAIVGLGVTQAASERFGYRRGMAGCLITLAVGLALAGFGATLLHSIPLTVIGLFLLGLGNGAVDVMMNVSGAAVERRIGKTIMPLFHACFSTGTVLGAALGALAAGAGLALAWHLSAVGALIVAAAVVAVRFVPDRITATDAATDAAERPAAAASVPLDAFDDPSLLRRVRLAVVARLAVWRDLTLVLIGVVMLGMAFAEGSANDWIALASVDGHGTSKAAAAGVLDAFMVAMTLGRVLGGPAVDRIGRVWTIRITAGFGIAGLLLFILGGPAPVYVVGVVLWGLGASLGFPLGMSAAADDERNATSRVAAVAMIGYLAFLAGPPFIGFLADRIGVLHSLFVVLALVVAAFLCAPALRPKPTATAG
ncbi:MFS transporter [Gryllotalpicola ginsengisoli]|uniref:MFS transporter n=1 Tax=Gryllotalpicola ginsengisoli TaxID=444608 RepID=UPI0003B342F2|nr:MFS transporter [Gryllotalpicola ginsengisoli]